MKSFVMRGLCLMLFFTLSVFLLQSCQKEEVITTDTVTSTVNRDWQETPDEDLVLFSKLLAKSQKRVEVRQFLDTWFKKDQLDESMVFFIQVKDQIVYENKSFLDIMEEEMESLSNASLRTDYFADLVALYPNLGFSIYTGSDDISIADFEYTSAVKVIPETEEFRKSEEKFEIGYDENLNEKSFSNNKAPNEPAIIVENSSQWVMLSMDEDLTQIGGAALVVELCDDLITAIYTTMLELWGTDEFIVIDGEVVGNPIYDVLVMDFNTYNQLWIEFCCTTCGSDDDDHNDDTTDPDPDPDPEEVCERDDRENDEVLVKLRIIHSELKEFCKWWKKNCEIEVKQIFVINPDAVALTESTGFIIAKRKDIKDHQWFESNLPMERFRYLDGTHGDAYSFALKGNHHNPDGSKTFSVGIKPKVKFKVFGLEAEAETGSLSFSWTIANNDNELGSKFIEYCDPANGEGEEYSTGKCDFFVKEEE